MKRGWSEVGRLGRSGSLFPHVLVSRSGWFLRMGPNSKEHDRYYSGLPSLLQGLIEHVVRRRMGETPEIGSIKDLVREFEESLEFAVGLARKTASRAALEGSGAALVAHGKAGGGGDELRRPRVLEAISGG